MGKNPQNRVRLRPVDLARPHGLSTQAVRNYEEAGILPAAARTESGYRTYSPLHGQALDTFLALLPGHGHPTATGIMRAVNRGADDEAFRLIDESHAQLLEDRRTLSAVENALRDLGSGAPKPRDPAPGTPHPGDPESRPPAPAAPAPPEGPTPTPAPTFIGPLADRLSVRPATLRKWEAAGLVRPRRDPLTGYRVYGEAEVRDARLVHQLRRGGYLLEQIAPLVDQVRAAGGLEPLEAALGDWRSRLATRGRALLTGAAKLDAYLNEQERERQSRGVLRISS
ncbi:MULTISPECIES: TioE family transcriptional regulator [Streptomyces]|uniref:TioE family transcriptional regulator n=1 Tax=Streptomyces TaxID=1883 RepID=UPI001040B7B3|nr:MULTISPECIES: TioE family transcriptional regulator [Streptomyces]MBT3075860.1 TioE family transcriptional regulator [Streptomyces sp. COG21]MBT3079626.1 TioE family transcriptional regulator [Streptomyces sp. COG20]MBT3086552.1 TioE family transcriptional regulator [Streptomyces sp. CYG21]MBT3099080.1 TioE family transcriptional regulator [Streptomyces sp. CBG30]MBT3099081.1 TioE family transcriptional regulator [Streptomyces sp. CBG30]